MVALGLSAILLAQVGTPTYWATMQLRPPTRRVPLVIVLRRPGLRPYEQVVEEFRSRVRASIRVVSIRGQSRATIVPWLTAAQPDLVLAVGQSAYDLVRKANLPPLVYTYVYHDQRADHYGVHNRVRPDHVLRALLAARPKVKQLAVLCSEGTSHLAQAAAVHAARHGIHLVQLRAETPGQAISVLRRAAGRLEALWLLADLRLITPQVVQYAVGLQFRLGIPLIGSTRRHVVQGALLAVAYDPIEIGRRAAQRASSLLGHHGRRRRRRMRSRRRRRRVAMRIARGPYGSGRPRLIFNATTAKRIDVDAAKLRTVAGEVIQ